MATTKMKPLLLPALAASLLPKVKIDHQMAQSILDNLGYTLQDLSLEYGDVVIPEGDISHQLYYGSTYNSANLIGYVNVENGIYWANPENNHKTAEQAALDLIAVSEVEQEKTEIQSNRTFEYD